MNKNFTPEAHKSKQTMLFDQHSKEHMNMPSQHKTGNFDVKAWDKHFYGQTATEAPAEEMLTPKPKVVAAEPRVHKLQHNRLDVKVPEATKKLSLKEKLGVGAGFLALAAVVVYSGYTDRGYSKNQISKMKYVQTHMSGSGAEGLLQQFEPSIVDGNHQGQVSSIEDAINSQENVDLGDHVVIVPVPKEYEAEAKEEAKKLHLTLTDSNS